MQNSQILRMIIVAGITFFVLFLIALFIGEQPTHQKAELSTLFEISLSWVLRFSGLGLTIFSIISLIMSASNDTKNFAKWSALIMLGVLIINTTWSLAFGIAIIFTALIITDYLGIHKKSSDASSD